jgi:hypothetical protein
VEEGPQAESDHDMCLQIQTPELLGMAAQTVHWTTTGDTQQIMAVLEVRKASSLWGPSAGPSVDRHWSGGGDPNFFDSDKSVFSEQR